MKSLRYILVLFHLLIGSISNLSTLYSQVKALVIGISQYQDNELKELHLPHRDAEIFASYLKNAPFLKLKEENLHLLTNARATSTQTTLALDRLFESAKKTDTIYLYFSGYAKATHNTHMEPSQIYLYDTPVSNMYSGSFNLLQRFMELANASQACFTVILNVLPMYISDSRLGNEVEAIENTSHSKSPIQTISFNSIPINFSEQDYSNLGNSTCSLNDFLLQGLMGGADFDMDKVVYWNELSRYFKNSNPVHEPSYGLLTITSSHPKDYHVFVNINNQKEYPALKESSSDYFVLDAEDELLSCGRRLKFADSLQFLLNDFIVSIKLNHLLFPAEDNASHRCDLILQRNELKEIHNDVKRRLAAELLDAVQQVLNDYLNAENHELQSRAVGALKYQQYTEYLARAAEILGPYHYLIPQITSKKYYFEGLQLRLLAQQSKDTVMLWKALEKQKNAKAIEREASYICNEIGVDYGLLGAVDSAKFYFITAIQLSSTWSIPYMNLALSYLSYDASKALSMSRQAVRLSPKSNVAHLILGLVYLEMNNLPGAEKCFRKSLDFNKNNPDAYYNLACIKSLKGKKEEAFSYLEAAFKAGFSDFEHLKKDVDLKFMRKDKNWNVLLEKYFSDKIKD